MNYIFQTFNFIYNRRIIPYYFNIINNVIENAKMLLLQLLSEHDVPASDIYKMAKKANISTRTVEEAKRELNIEAKKVGKQWLCSMPNLEQEVI